MNTIISREDALKKLEKYQNYNKRYRNYPGSPGDDCLLGIYGYTVREERGYIRHMITKYKKAINWMDDKGVNEISDREFFYL